MSWADNMPRRVHVFIIYSGKIHHFAREEVHHKSACGAADVLVVELDVAWLVTPLLSSGDRKQDRHGARD